MYRERISFQLQHSLQCHSYTINYYQEKDLPSNKTNESIFRILKLNQVLNTLFTMVLFISHITLLMISLNFVIYSCEDVIVSDAKSQIELV